MAEREGEWIVALGSENKDFLVKQTLADNLQSKFVHFFVVYQGAEILASYDRMCTVILEQSFPSHKLLRGKHSLFLRLME